MIDTIRHTVERGSALDDTRHLTDPKLQGLPLFRREPARDLFRGYGDAFSSRPDAVRRTSEHLFGVAYHPHEIADMLGHLTGGTTRVEDDRYWPHRPYDKKRPQPVDDRVWPHHHPALEIHVAHPGRGVDFRYVIRTHGVSPSGPFTFDKPVARLEYAMIGKPVERMRYTGAKILARHIKGLRDMGVKELQLYAKGAGNHKDGPHGEHVGYYTMPRYGFSMPVPENRRDFVEHYMPKGTPPTQRVRDLLETSEGRRAWLLHGSANDAVFDLDPASEDSKWHRAYLESKGWTP